jgi:hypothetical protein
VAHVAEQHGEAQPVGRAAALTDDRQVGLATFAFDSPASMRRFISATSSSFGDRFRPR